MRAVLYALSFLAVMGLAFWAYRENYATQKSLRHVEDLQTEIGTLREALTVQRAEWAYLNRPDRLRELSTILDGTSAGIAYLRGERLVTAFAMHRMPPEQGLQQRQRRLRLPADSSIILSLFLRGELTHDYCVPSYRKKMTDTRQYPQYFVKKG